MVKPTPSGPVTVPSHADTAPLAVWSRRLPPDSPASSETLLTTLGTFQPILARSVPPDARVKTRPQSELEAPARAWQTLQSLTRTLSPQKQRGLDPFAPPELTFVTLPIPQLEQTLEATGSFSALCTLVDAGIQQGRLRLVGDRLLLLQHTGATDPDPTDAVLRSFDITPTARAVAQRLLSADPEEHDRVTVGPAASPQARALVHLLQARMPERDETHIQPLVSTPGPSPVAVRPRNVYLSSKSEAMADPSTLERPPGVAAAKGSGSPSPRSPLGEPMPTLTMPGSGQPSRGQPSRGQPSRGQTSQGRTSRDNTHAPRSGRPMRPRRITPAPRPGQAQTPPGQGASSGRPRAQASASGVSSGSMGGAPLPIPRPRRAPTVMPGAPMRVESTLNELARVVRQDQQQEQEDAHDRTF